MANRHPTRKIIPLRPDISISALARQHGVSRQTVRRRLAAGTLTLPRPADPMEIVAPDQGVATHGHPDQAPGQAEPIELVPAPKFLYGLGRGLVGLILIAAGAVIAVTSIGANVWFANSMTSDPSAAKIFATLSATAEVVAVALPSALRFYWQRREWVSCLTGLMILMIALSVVALASSGFVVTNVSDAVLHRADRTTASVAIAQAALDDARAARDRECIKVGPICRQREDTVNQRQAELDSARGEVRSDADPQAEALHVSSRALQTIKGAAMVAMCLGAGLVIALGSGLLFARGRCVP